MKTFKLSKDEGDTHNKDTCTLEFAGGNAISLDLNKDDCEVRADVVVKKAKAIRIWGQVRDCNGVPIVNALIKLIKITRRYGKVRVLGIAHTTTDCAGFYQFNVPYCPVGSKYKVLVGKAVTKSERQIPLCKLLCNPCKDNSSSCKKN